jgi:hypothetical protein
MQIAIPGVLGVLSFPAQPQAAKRSDATLRTLVTHGIASHPARLDRVCSQRKARLCQPHDNL